MRSLSCFSVLFVIACTSALPLKHGKNFLPIEDSIVRNKIFPLAAGAYSDNPENCVKNKFVDGTVQKKVKQVCGDGFQEPENCFGYTALLNNDKAIVLAFRGTHGFIQLIYEIDRTVFKEKINATIGGQVANYFYSVYTAVMDNGLSDSLSQLVKDHPDYDVWVTGHSLGGALASIAASEIIALNYVSADKVKLYTFGQPRTGDVEYAAAHDKIVPTSYRITHYDDIVPHLPYENFENYFHHKSEIWYNNNMEVGDTYIECDEDESNSCSDGAFWKYSIPDHLYYYGKFVTGYGFNGCV
ncbi:Lipase domain containing protein [Aphelenchoides bicaudatus]|nr:Lipase domain containing protein [Aphelenchoides bicaudatus]